jgi:hypothetical protein
MPHPLRVLYVIANPVDLTRFDDARFWSDSARPLQGRADIVFERMADPQEGSLRKSLRENEWHAVHFVLHAQERRAANYASIALEATDGRAKNLTAAYLAPLLSAGTVKLVVLQACEPASYNFKTLGEALAGRGLAVATAPPLTGVSQEVFVSKLYSGAAAGLSPAEISKDITAALAASTHSVEPVRMLSQRMGEPIFIDQRPQPAHVVVPPAPELRVAPTPLQDALQGKLKSGAFDVFLCHNTADKPAVMRIGHQLREAGVLPWLDVWELPPGQPWQPLLEQQIGGIKSAAVFVGSAGFGPWQEQEMYGFLRRFVARQVPVIPVLLGDAPTTPNLPIFLEAMTWVDFRSSDPDPLRQLIWGITRKRPDDVSQ